VFDGAAAAGAADAEALAADVGMVGGLGLGVRAVLADEIGGALAGVALFADELREAGAAPEAGAGFAADAAAVRALAQLARLGASSFAVLVAGGAAGAGFEPPAAVGAVAGASLAGLAEAELAAAGGLEVGGAAGLGFGLLLLPGVPGVRCAAASLVAAALNEAVLAIGTRAASRSAAASAGDGVAVAGAALAVGAVALGAGGGGGGGGGAVSISSTTGSSSSSSAGASGAFSSAAGLRTGMALAVSPGARNISGSMKLSPVCSGSFGGGAPAAGLAGVSAVAAVADDVFGPAAALEPSTGSTGKSGSNSSGGRDAASI
jgi:hypothetical protein